MKIIHSLALVMGLLVIVSAYGQLRFDPSGYFPVPSGYTSTLYDQMGIIAVVDGRREKTNVAKGAITNVTDQATINPVKVAHGELITPQFIKSLEEDIIARNNMRVGSSIVVKINGLSLESFIGESMDQLIAKYGPCLRVFKHSEDEARRLTQLTLKNFYSVVKPPLFRQPYLGNPNG